MESQLIVFETIQDNEKFLKCMIVDEKEEAAEDTKE